MRPLAAKILAALLLPALAARAADLPAPNLLPAPARWTDLPDNLRNVVIDPTGRPWFEAALPLGAPPITLEALKSQVEHAADPAVKTPLLTGMYLLLIDAQHRIWVLPEADSSELLCYDPAAHTWSTRTTWQTPSHNFRTESHASKNGTLYFAGYRGVYTLSPAGDWHYENFFPTLTEHEYVEPIRFAEDDQGIVYAWSPPGMQRLDGATRVWRHDGHAWSTFVDNAPPVMHPRNYGGMLSITPLADQLLLCPLANSGAPSLLPNPSATPPDEKHLAADIARLADAAFDERKAAQERLRAAGPAALPALRASFTAAADAETKAALQNLFDPYDNPVHPTFGGLPFLRAIDLGAHTSGKSAAAVIWAVEADDRGRIPTPPNGGVVHPWYTEQGRLYLADATGKVTPLSTPIIDTPYLATFATRDNHLLLGIKGRGLFRIEADRSLTPLTSASDADFFNVLAEDAAGRLYLADHQIEGNWPRLNNNPHLAVLDLAHAEARKSLDSQSFPVSSYIGGGYFAIDSAGRPWAKLAGQNHAFVSTFEKGQWNDVPLPQGMKPPSFVWSIQPLAQEAVIVCTSPNEPAAFLDKGQWTAYPALESLVSANADRLRQLLEGPAGLCRVPVLTKDAAGNLWILNSGKALAYTGKTWVHPTFPPTPHNTGPSIGRMLPLDGGKQILLVGFDNLFAATLSNDTAHLTNTGAEHLSAFSAYSENTDGLFLDSGGRIWLPGNGFFAYRSDGAKFQEFAGIRNARCEDHAHRIWFAQRDHLVALLPDDRQLSFPADNLFEYTAIAEDAPDSLWITTTRGLSHFAIHSAAENALTLQHLEDITTDVPRSARCLFTTDHALWTTTPIMDRPPLLYRLQLP